MTDDLSFAPLKDLRKDLQKNFSSNRLPRSLNRRITWPCSRDPEEVAGHEAFNPHRKSLLRVARDLAPVSGHPIQIAASPFRQGARLRVPGAQKRQDGLRIT